LRIEYSAHSLCAALPEFELKPVIAPTERLCRAHRQALRFKGVDRTGAICGQRRRICYHAGNEHGQLPG
jgi:hypothetical protein